MVCDPRAVHTSTRDGYPPSRGCYCEVERWRDVWARVQAQAGDPDVEPVRFEDLVTEPARVEERLRAAKRRAAQHHQRLAEAPAALAITR